MIEKWRKSLDKRKKCGVLLTDLSKAFDCLLHDLFIAKLHAYGFDYLSLKLIHSYLVGRMQRVRVNACYSDWSVIDTGVPQGSVLGPELYKSLNITSFYIGRLAHLVERSPNIREVTGSSPPLVVFVGEQ